MKHFLFIAVLLAACGSKKAAQDKGAGSAAGSAVGSAAAEPGSAAATEHQHGSGDRMGGGGGKGMVDAEVEHRLDAIGKHVKSYYAENAAFPKGSIGLTPAKACCPAACPPDPAAWQNPIWKSLDFQIDEASHAQYTFDSDGSTGFTVTAVADPGCAGTPVTTTLTGKVENGNVTTQISGQ